ncbi:MAG: DNA polymerase IV [Thermocaproicibacter melissae]|jgi:DNA polymerase IV|uniref:DNA polymerase IV n=1 Tax=Thermocaproicibacter melissae TaxID=2966552 RepID=UPI0024B0595D|nr:DNA polymerase IV [Thermocaproicibacter melissae]WBY64469.1 DNA polymerase IV [Thermocaproicibacter melissae]
MERVILHSDCNSFYASVECLYHPEIRNKPVAVGGEPEHRHGIILTKNGIAKKYGVKTGEPLWKAKQKCPDLVIIPPNYPLYQRFSEMARKIYLEYTDKVEPFGIDESWLDVTGSAKIYGDGEKIAREINRRVKEELGITVSVGVSWNKIFAKFGSDYKKPDAVTVITKENYKEIIWPQPVEDLLYVGPATKRKLNGIGIHTIGELAAIKPEYLRAKFGKWGDVLHDFSNGLDITPVAEYDSTRAVKSIGNSTTTIRDLKTEEDVKMVLFVLAESVGRRMREQGFKGRELSVAVRDNELCTIAKQCKFEKFTNISSEIAEKAFWLFRKFYSWYRPIRSIGISVSDFAHDNIPTQTDLFCDERQRIRMERLDSAVDVLKRRFGNYCVQRASLLKEPTLTRFNPKDENTIHPIGYF